jgi:hypothetical protein
LHLRIAAIPYFASLPIREEFWRLCVRYEKRADIHEAFYLWDAL